MFMFIKAVSSTVSDMIIAVYHAKPLIFIGTTFHEKLVSHHHAVNINCWIRLSLSGLFLTLYLTRSMPTSFWFYRGYVSGEARLPSSGLLTSSVLQVVQCGCGIFVFLLWWPRFFYFIQHPVLDEAVSDVAYIIADVDKRLVLIPLLFEYFCLVQDSFVIISRPLFSDEKLKQIS